jgi:hypothetical protein
VEEILKFSGSERGEKYERHCPQQGKGLNCIVPRPKGYKKHILWPQSRDEVLLLLLLLLFRFLTL